MGSLIRSRALRGPQIDKWRPAPLFYTKIKDQGSLLTSSRIIYYRNAACMVYKPSYIKSKTAGKANLPHFILHHLQQLRRKRLLSSRPYLSKGNLHIIPQYYKSFQEVSRINGPALSDINTRYATKKRSPE